MFWRRGRSAPDDAAGGGTPEDAFAAARERMVRDQIEARGLRDPELLRAMRSVARHAFVDSAHAYEDRALPLGEGQTISQPYIVALMTDAARPPAGWSGARVLEVGTGSGYQAALLAELGAEVITVERHAELSRQAAERIATLGYRSVTLVVGDGSAGYPERAPFDSVLVTAAAPGVPPPILEQLRPDGGRLVMPVGSRDHQVMTLVVREGDTTSQRELDACVFVPLLGTFGVRDSSL